MTRSPALTSPARSGVAIKFAISKAHAAARAIDINPGFVSRICLVLLLLFILLHEVNGGMLRAEHADDDENGKPERDLDHAVALEPAQRFKLPLAARRSGQPWRQPEPVNGRECQHEGENDELEDQYLSVSGNKQ